MTLNLSALGDMPCLPIGSMGPLQEGQSWCPGGEYNSQLACMPVGSMGPLGPGQVWCDTGSATPSPADTLSPATAQSSQSSGLFSGISTTTVGLAVIALIAVVSLGGRR